MDLALLVYAISVFSSLGPLCIFLAVISIASLVISFISYCDAHTEKPFWRKSINVTLSILIPSLILTVAIPSEKTMYTMVGAYAAQKVAEDPKVQQLSAKVLKLVENRLDSYIEEATTAKK